MSYAIPQTSLAGLTAGQNGSVDWTTVAQSIGFPDPSQRPHIQFYNESPCELQMNLSTGEQFILPAGGWQTIEINPNCTKAAFQVIAVLNASPIVALLLGTWYAPGETVPAAPILGNSPIGGSVTNNVSNYLQGIGQSLELTEVDITGTASLVPAGAGVGQKDMGLAVVNTSGTITQVVGLVFNLVTILTNMTIAGSVGIIGKFTSYNGEILAGNGLVVNEEDTDNQNVTTTGGKTIVSYVVPATSSGVATIRASGYVIVNNSVSGNNCTFNVNYKDQGGASISRSLPMFSGLAAVTIMTGGISIPNSHYEGYPLTITVQQSQTVTITYNDPTNTPNDRVTGVIERLS